MSVMSVILEVIAVACLVFAAILGIMSTVVMAIDTHAVTASHARPFGSDDR